MELKTSIMEELGGIVADDAAVSTTLSIPIAQRNVPIAQRNEYAPPPPLKANDRRRASGRKSGRGFYDYAEV